MQRSRKQLNLRSTSLAANVVRLSSLLTSGREHLPAAYLVEPALREAYRTYYLPANMAKVHKPLEELLHHPANLLGRSVLRIADIGSGPGTAVLGTLGFFARQGWRPRLEMVAVDRVAENLHDAEMQFCERRDAYGLDATLMTVKLDVEHIDRLRSGPFDLMILSNVLNELFMRDADCLDKRASLLAEILRSSLADEGCCIIIEPALRDTSRGLLGVRDRMIADGFTVYAPCLGNAVCPALDNPKDWCHEEVPWDPPAEVREIDAITGLRKDALKFSYLVLRRDRLSLADVCGSDAFRIVSEPLVSKGKREYYVCGPQGRRLTTRLDRDATDRNRDFDRLQRGDVVHIQGMVERDARYRVEKTTEVFRHTFRDHHSGTGSSR